LTGHHHAGEEDVIWVRVFHNTIAIDRGKTEKMRLALEQIVHRLGATPVQG